MSTLYKESASISPTETSDTYIYSIVQTIENGIAAISSNDELFVVDKLSLSSDKVVRFPSPPKGTSCLVSGNAEGSMLVCSGSSGEVAVFDVRAQKRVGGFKTDRAVTALACNGEGIAIGTELAHHQAVVSLWDQRQYKQIWQNTENNDDITALDFHPSRPNQLLCGGDDGLVSVFDTNISEEDDSLLQAVNHGPIHKAGFLGSDRLFALSSDQNLAIHAVSTPDDNEDPSPTLFGDLRPVIPCEYVINVFRTGEKYAVAAASNINNPRIDIVEIHNAVSSKKAPTLDLGSRHTLQGAHGEEVVRSILADEATGIIYTAGEDGLIRAFQPVSSTGTPSKQSKNTKKATDTRYKPY